MATYVHAPPLPRRFRENEARGRRLGRPLRRLGRLRGPVDEALMARIGVGLTERDEPAGVLADAIRTRAGEPGRVTHAQLRAALAGGLDAVPEAPEALRDFIETVSDVPDWVDWDRVDRGGLVFRRLGQSAADVLLQLSLIGGYRFGGPSDLLVATGALTGGQTARRLAETQHWASSLGTPGALRPYAEAWRLTVHVRAMHALVNASFTPTWDHARFGLPINMSDQAGTLGLFDGTVLVSCRALGIPVSRSDAADYMHMWRYVGWLMGVHEDFLTDDERERTRINYHILLAAGDLTAAGTELARSAVVAQRDRHFPGWPGPLQHVRARYETERLLSMLSAFLGRQGMADLGLTWRLPWAMAYVIPLNLWRYRVRGRGPEGRRRLEEQGKRVSDRILASYFHGSEGDVAALP